MKKLNKYFNSREKAIIALLKLPRKNYTDDSFHDLRVEIKKLDALFEMIDAVKKGFKRKKIFKPFKQVFQHAGKIRELQVEMALVAEHSPGNLLEYRKCLNEEISKQEQEFSQMLNKKLIKRVDKSFDKATSALKKIKAREVEAFILKSKKKLDFILGSKPVDIENAHVLRKQLKKFNYNIKSLELKKYDDELLNDTLPKLLGDWHDYRVTVRHMEEELKNGKVAAVETGQVEGIMGKFSGESERLFEEINQTIEQPNSKS